MKILSFGVPCYNSEAYMEKCIESLLVGGDDVEIIITIGSETAIVNGEEVLLDSPVFLENGRTYTPIRFVAERLGADVEWDEAEERVIIKR